MLFLLKIFKIIGPDLIQIFINQKAQGLFFTRVLKGCSQLSTFSQVYKTYAFPDPHPPFPKVYNKNVDFIIKKFILRKYS